MVSLWPRIAAGLPDAELWLVGHQPARAHLELPPGVIDHGVVDDVDAVLVPVSRPHCAGHGRRRGQGQALGGRCARHPGRLQSGGGRLDRGINRHDASCRRRRLRGPVPRFAHGRRSCRRRRFASSRHQRRAVEGSRAAGRRPPVVGRMTAPIGAPDTRRLPWIFADRVCRHDSSDRGGLLVRGYGPAGRRRGHGRGSRLLRHRSALALGLRRVRSGLGCRPVHPRPVHPGATPDGPGGRDLVRVDVSAGFDLARRVDRAVGRAPRGPRDAVGPGHRRYRRARCSSTSPGSPPRPWSSRFGTCPWPRG